MIRTLHISLLTLLCVPSLFAIRQDSFQVQKQERIEQIRLFKQYERAHREACDRQLALQLQKEEYDYALAWNLHQALNQEFNNARIKQMRADELLARRLQEQFARDEKRSLRVQSQPRPQQPVRVQPPQQRPSQVQRPPIQVQVPQMPSVSVQALQMQGNRAIAPCVFNTNLLLNLPGMANSKIKGVYHINSSAEVPNRLRWSCGLHALYNMVKMERRICGFQLDDSTFINVCKQYTKNPENSSFLHEIEQMARAIRLPHTHYLLYENGCSIVYAYTSQPFRDAAYQKNAWANIRAAFERAKGPMCMHFCCRILSQGIQHSILISVVKMADGATAFYIHDNENKGGNHTARLQICGHVNNIYKQLFE